ncbi:MAG: Na+/H+ antiporter NhaA [Myxococcota bacterium]
MSREKKGFVNILQEFSIPLLLGVGVALVVANLWPGWYAHALHWEPFGKLTVLGHAVSLHFLVNDVFMVFFFGIAAKEITEACLPGGSLNPLRKALNPLIATLGGVVGPGLVFLAGLWICYASGIYSTETVAWGTAVRGWGVPTATDIALAWLVSRAVFGKGHPAIDFLLLLAIADDAIGLVIIAVFYGDPSHPSNPAFLGLVAAAMGLAFALRRVGLRLWPVYVFGAGPLAWTGLVLAHLHPALALVFVVPFLPGPRRDVGLFREQDEVDLMGEALAHDLHIEHSPLYRFEHQLKLFVDLGLFFFAFTNAGVAFSEIGPMTWLILGGLVIGKTIGVTSLGLIATRLGLPLPSGMGLRELVMAGFIAALGLTVALFVATAAFQDPGLQGQAKMGALFSGFVGLAALLLGRLVGLGPARTHEPSRSAAVAALHGPVAPAGSEGES